MLITEQGECSQKKAAILHYQPHHQGNMAFAGKYEFESDENYDDFVKAIGLPSEKVEMGRNCKIVTEVVQNGNDFTWTQHFPGGRTTTNTFTIGKEADMETMGGKKFKATVKMEGGKVVADFPNYHHTAEIAGGKLVEGRFLLNVCVEGVQTLAAIRRATRSISKTSTLKTIDYHYADLGLLLDLICLNSNHNTKALTQTGEVSGQFTFKIELPEERLNLQPRSIWLFSFLR
ncbi:gastrotropin isoform X1 [Cygnus olor]|uniref:gastrotropin isoform X1 n=2 Tax=Cygnus olor TaxID=8869 RepID=UPI001ADDE74D|nr:gastrotropin isoform X1 [Cygnus olor]XP_040429677.1 gastrotropin isoform X1 [Cygnus olor]XP_040429678.1 gastrotropin isoform X1 [Cygnus olor]XP_040429679.1 gastrotropin isoform X1 [Cygnus olor]